MQWQVLGVLFGLLAITSQARTLYSHLEPNHASIEFAKTLYYADLRPTVRWHVGSHRASSDWGLALTSTPPGFSDELYPEVGLFKNASAAVRRVTYESAESLWLSRTRALSLGGAREFHVAPFDPPANTSTPPHSAQDHEVSGWLFLGPGSALWRSLAGYVMSDFRLALVRDTAYFALLGDARGTTSLVCQAPPSHIQHILPVHAGACYVVGLDYNIILDFEAPHNYLPSDLFAAWEVSEHSYLQSVALEDGDDVALVTWHSMSYELNSFSNEIVLGAPYLRYLDEVAYDAAAHTYYLRSDAAASNMYLGAEIVNVLGYLAAAYLMMISHSSTHFAIPRYVLHYRKHGVPLEVGLDGSRVRFEIAAIILAVLAFGTTVVSIPDGYLLAFVVLAIVLVVHIGVALYILIRAPELTRAGLFGTDDVAPRHRPDKKHQENSYMDLPKGTFIYPSLALRDSTQRALARGTNHLMLLYAAVLMLTIAIADHALFLLLGTIVTALIVFTMSYHIAGMALFIGAMDGSVVPPRFAPLWYVYMATQLITALATIATGLGYFVWPYVVYASNSYHSGSILDALLLLPPALLVFGGVLKLHLDVRADVTQVKKRK